MRYPTEYVDVSMGVDDRYYGRATTYPGLENRWLALVAYPDHLAAILEGVVVLILRCAVVKVKGAIS